MVSSYRGSTPEAFASARDGACASLTDVNGDTALPRRSLMGQAIVIEKLFSWPGIGSLLVDSVSTRDIPVVQGTVIVIVLWFLVINMLVDVAYAAIDPRIKVT